MDKLRAYAAACAAHADDCWRRLVGREFYLADQLDAALSIVRLVADGRGGDECLRTAFALAAECRGFAQINGAVGAEAQATAVREATASLFDEYQLRRVLWRCQEAAGYGIVAERAWEKVTAREFGVNPNLVP